MSLPPPVLREMQLAPSTNRTLVVRSTTSTDDKQWAQRCGTSRVRRNSGPRLPPATDGEDKAVLDLRKAHRTVSVLVPECRTCPTSLVRPTYSASNQSMSDWTEVDGGPLGQVT